MDIKQLLEDKKYKKPVSLRGMAKVLVNEKELEEAITESKCSLTKL